MGLLIDVYYKKYRETGLNVPDEVKKYTMEYQRQCDMYSDFIIECMEETEDKEIKMPIGDLHEELKIWYMENFNDSKTVPSKRDLKKYLEKRYGQKRLKGDDVQGCKFKTNYTRRASEGIKLNSILGDFQ